MHEKPEKALFYKNGLRFSCKNCSNCCRYESGYVFLSENDVMRAAAVLKMNCKEFCSVFCRWISSINGKEQLSLREKSNFDCILWDSNAGKKNEGGCSVYEARPMQCRTFPFWPNMLDSGEIWENASKDCPGIGQGNYYSLDFINKSMMMMKNETIISRNISGISLDSRS